MAHSKTRICKLCGKEFVYKHNSQVYCQKQHLAKCPICGKERLVENGKIDGEYSTTTCSKACRAEKTRQNNLEKYGVESPMQLPEVRAKIAATNLERYGAENVFASDYGQQKIKETTLERYGVEYASQSQEVKGKIEATNMERYGTKAPAQNKEVQAKMKATNLERYGAENVYASDYGKQKIKETNLERYGVENVGQAPEIQARIKATTLENYGVENPYESEEIKEKIKETMLERYGVEHALQSDELLNKFKQTNLERYGIEFVQQRHILNIDDWNNLEDYLSNRPEKPDCLQLANYFGVSIKSVRKRVLELGLESYIDSFHKYSKPELIFKELIDSLDVEYLSHSKKLIPPYELDFYFPGQKLAVEISPTFTHKFMLDETYIMGIEEKEYHYNKFKACEDAGIELITVFDWVDVETIFNLVKDKITKSKYRIYARKCEVKNVGKITKKHRTFLTKYHVLGSINNKGDSFVLELTYEDLLVGLAVFYPHKEGLELKRLAFRDDYTIVGGASKLVKHAGDKPIITFSDNNLGTGSVYKTIGFELIEDNKHSLMFFHDEYGWLIRDTSLWMVGADRLLQNFPGYKPVGIGEDKPNNREIVLSYGFTPIFDCGYRKWRLDE